MKTVNSVLKIYATKYLEQLGNEYDVEECIAIQVNLDSDSFFNDMIGAKGYDAQKKKHKVKTSQEAQNMMIELLNEKLEELYNKQKRSCQK
jgi:hypothetical protein